MSRAVLPVLHGRMGGHGKKDGEEDGRRAMTEQAKLAVKAGASAHGGGRGVVDAANSRGENAGVVSAKVARSKAFWKQVR